ncbi:MAG TPA: hypothetical protein VFL34_11890 [Candidatus Sulfotelmatobacter sp.]|nr:hypothetical protein [Candidatus Sulfotelmatobacter sp.]
MKVKAVFKMNLARSLASIISIALLILALSPITAGAQSCQTASDLDDAARTAITSAGQRLFAMATKGDAPSLRQNSIPSLASDFGGIEGTIKDHEKDLAAAQATVKGVFLLDGSTPSPHAEFYCGVFGKSGQTSNSAVFYLDNLPAGKYGVVLLDANSPQGKTMFSLILQQVGTDWKLGGLYVLPGQVAGHDSDWFLNKAREYKAKGQLHNAWFYFLEGRTLSSPLPFMSTLATDKLYDEAHSVQPPDVPVGKTADLQAGTTTYKLISMFPQIVGNDLDLIVKYQAADISNSNVTYQGNVNVIKAVATKYPEVRDAFAAIVARAVDPTGRDYGTLLAMKDIK